MQISLQQYIHSENIEYQCLPLTGFCQLSEGRCRRWPLSDQAKFPENVKPMTEKLKQWKWQFINSSPWEYRTKATREFKCTFERAF